jgi:NAD(P)-dependent dehydrogenase (short-subunit alcohol dehydrogenase family)
MELTPPKTIHDMFDLDFFAYVSTIRAFLPLLKQSKGRVINVVSYGAYVNPPMWVPYSAIKAALEAMTRAWRMELVPFGVAMTSIRPGWTRTHGIGPKISSAWKAYHEGIEKGAVGVNSLGEVIRSDYPVGKAEKEVYGRMMKKWEGLTKAAAEGVGEPAEAVALTIHDALTDVFCQPNYTVGYDALFGQMVRDLCPESLYELSLMKTLG